MKNIAAIAKEFKVPEDRLAETLEIARNAHDVAKSFPETGRDLDKLLEKISELRETWEELSPLAEQLMASQRETVQSLEEFVIRKAEDLKSFRGEFVPDGRYQQLVGLHTFTRSIKDVWTHHRNGERFGCLFEDGQPANDASRFLWDCVQWLDCDYTSTNVESCMRKAQEGEPPVRIANKDDMALSEISEALNKLRPPPT